MKLIIILPFWQHFIVKSSSKTHYCFSLQANNINMPVMLVLNANQAQSSNLFTPKCLKLRFLIDTWFLTVIIHQQMFFARRLTHTQLWGFCVVMSRWEHRGWTVPTSRSRWRPPALRLPEEPKRGGGLEKLRCWYLPSAPSWEPHVKTDTCSLIALSQGPDCVCVCLDDSRLLSEPLIWVCGTVLA